MNVQNFIFKKDTPLEDLGNGLKRRIAAYHDNLMCVEMHFEKGAEGVMHSHPHEQISYVISGKFEFTVGDKTHVISAGDCTLKQPNIEHGAVCLEPGVLIDFFTPCREDFLS